MLNCVPLPVIHTCSGNMSWCWPARISSQVCTISEWREASRRPLAWFALAAAFFRMAYAVIISRGMRSWPMLKCSSERCVCAPHSLSAGTLTTPRLSISLRMSFIVSLAALEEFGGLHFGRLGDTLHPVGILGFPQSTPFLDSHCVNGPNSFHKAAITIFGQRRRDFALPRFFSFLFEKWDAQQGRLAA